MFVLFNNDLIIFRFSNERLVYYLGGKFLWVLWIRCIFM